MAGAPRSGSWRAAPAIAVGALLAVSALAVLVSLHRLAMDRYLTVDELQFGHATWLVSQGEVPYVDFYEHHFPALYVLHAPLVRDDDVPFVDRALRLRSASFAWLVVLSLSLGVATGRMLRDPLAGLLAAQLPLAFGFSALSAVDYRADNFAGVAWLACLAALEIGRCAPRRGLAAAAGLLFGLALLATQKLALIGGPVIALWWLWDRSLRREDAAPAIPFPGSFALAGGALLLSALAAAAALGMLGPGFEATVLHAFGHEEHYPRVALGAFVRPFWDETAVTTAAILGLAGIGFASRRGRFLALPLAVALLVTLSIRGRFPYNYLVPCVLLGVLAVRGAAACIARMRSRWPAIAPFAPLLYLLPLLLLPDQLGFVHGRTSNAHQLHVLAKIERFTAPGDVVIDDAGGALFRPHASHVWYHGPAHRAVLADHFEQRLPADLRESRALFWIRDFRLAKLPAPVQRLFEDHYVRADGWLHAMGFVLPARDDAHEREIEVLRAGTWFAWPAPGGRVAPAGPARGVWIDGRAVGPDGVRLEEGTHRVRVAGGSPPVLLTPLPREVFLDRFERMRPYALLFEYARRPHRAWRDRTLLTP